MDSFYLVKAITECSYLEVKSLWIEKIARRCSGLFLPAAEGDVTDTEFRLHLQAKQPWDPDTGPSNCHLPYHLCKCIGTSN